MILEYVLTAGNAWEFSGCPTGDEYTSTPAHPSQERGATALSGNYLNSGVHEGQGQGNKVLNAFSAVGYRVYTFINVLVGD